MNTRGLLIGAAAAALAAAPAIAQDNSRDVTVAGVYQAYFFEADDEDVTLNALGVRGGIEIAENIEFEGELLFGVGDDDIDGISPGVDASVELNYSVAVYGKYEFDVADNFDVFGRVGVGYLEAEASAGGASDSEGEEFIAAGVGGEFDVTEQVSVRGDVGYLSFFDADDIDDGFTVGASVVYTF